MLNTLLILSANLLLASSDRVIKGLAPKYTHLRHHGNSFPKQFGKKKVLSNDRQHKYTHHLTHKSSFPTRFPTYKPTTFPTQSVVQPPPDVIINDNCQISKCVEWTDTEWCDCYDIKYESEYI